MRLDLEQVKKLRVLDDDLEHQPLVRNELDHDELGDEVLSGYPKRLPDHAPLPQKPGRLEHGADDRVHPSRLLGDVEHHRGDRLGRCVEDRLHGDVETPVLRREPPQCPEDREDREDRTEKRCPDEELDDHKDESGNRELLRLHGSRLEHEVVAAVYPGAVDEKCSDQESHDQYEKPGLYQQEEHARPSLDSPRVGQYVVTSDARHVDRDLVWRFLHHEAYWSQGVPRDVVDRAIDGSICFSAFEGDPDRDGRQVAFARMVTDRATFAWLCDVFVLAEHRGKGVGKQLMDAVMAHPDLQGLRNILLATRDAHGLYARYGFVPLAEPARWMAIRRPYRSSP